MLLIFDVSAIKTVNVDEGGGLELDKTRKKINKKYCLVLDFEKLVVG